MDTALEAADSLGLFLLDLNILIFQTPNWNEFFVQSQEYT
jgi:hypothetical protein